MDAMIERPPMVVSEIVQANMHRVLASIRTHLRMDIAFITEFLDFNRVFRAVEAAPGERILVTGDLVPMASGYCRHIVSGRLPELIPDTRDVPLAWDIPETSALPIGAHLSVPIRVEAGRVFGTFCCLSHRARPDLGPEHLELMRTFAQLIATELTGEIEAEAERRRKGERVRQAMRTGDPTMVFQPIVDLADATLVGVEALARFRGLPVRPPDQWFAEAHAAGLGDDLELLAVAKALRACDHLPAPITVSVNVSPGTLVSASLDKVLLRGDPRRIVVEITEHAPVDDYEAILRALDPLRRAGVQVAIDDAGAGYSSLRHVLAMRPDIIKFDFSLTRGLDRDPVRQAMVAALAEFGRRTGTRIVAEGVETDDEVRTLQELGVRLGQGYRLGRPQALDLLLGPPSPPA